MPLFRSSAGKTWLHASYVNEWVSVSNLLYPHFVPCISVKCKDGLGSYVVCLCCIMWRTFKWFIGVKRSLRGHFKVKGHLRSNFQTGWKYEIWPYLKSWKSNLNQIWTNHRCSMKTFTSWQGERVHIKVKGHLRSNFKNGLKMWN